MLNALQVNRFLRQTKDVTLTDAFRGSPFKGVAVSVSMLFFDATAGNVYKVRPPPCPPLLSPHSACMHALSMNFFDATAGKARPPPVPSPVVP